MNVVLDTNIFVSGIFWKGEPYKILMLWKEGKIQLINSIEIITEISRILSDFKIQLSDENKKEWIHLITNNSKIVEPYEKFDIIKDDPTDNKFIDVAIAGKAEYIITRDKHLLKIKQFRTVKIILPEDFLKQQKF
jgi:putative PIN family toxin of toxin-antitoxin system